MSFFNYSNRDALFGKLYVLNYIELIIMLLVASTNIELIIMSLVASTN